MQSAWSPEAIIAGLAAVGSFLTAVIGLKVNAAISKAHNEMILRQEAIRQDLDEKHNENKTGLAVHIAEDRGEFKQVFGKLNDIEAVLQKRFGDAGD